MVVYTVGTFDLLHVGHLALLEYCATLGNTVAVGVASDEVVKLYKPNIPVIPLEQRIEMLQALRCVDIVLPYHELDYLSVCEEVKADIFVIGEDWGRLSKYIIRIININNIQCLEKYIPIKRRYLIRVQLSNLSRSLNNQSLINS